jgi:hypothetical protein
MTHPIIHPNAYPHMLDMFQQQEKEVSQALDFTHPNVRYGHYDYVIQWRDESESLHVFHTSATTYHGMEAQGRGMLPDAKVFHLDGPIWLERKNSDEMASVECDLRDEGWEEGVDYDYIPLFDACEAMRPLLHLRKARLQQLIDDFSKAIAA